MGKRITKQDAIDRGNVKHNNKFDYSLVEFSTVKDKVKIICPEHGIFEQELKSHLSGSGCVKCHNQRTGRRQQSCKQEFIKKARKTHGDTYDYSRVVYKASQTPVEIVCEKHGSFWQRPNNHIQGQTCLKCSLRQDTLIFLDRAHKVHGHKYDYSKVDFKTWRGKVEIICPLHGSFWQTAHHHVSDGTQCPMCSRRRSRPEKEIQRFIEQELDLEVKVRDRSVISPQELDIYIPSKKIAVEFNGNYWHCELKREPKFHQRKTQACENAGIQLIHIFHYMWETQSESFKCMLKAKLGRCSHRVHGRKCQAREITKSEAKLACEAWHLQGDSQRSTKQYGLFHENQLVGVATFCKPRFNTSYEWELLRLCFKPNHYVVGGGGKLLKLFEKQMKPKSLVSYAKRDWSDGSVYKALGFTLLNKTRPGYVWWKHNTHEVLPRYKTQKHKLETLLSYFDPKKSEIQNMIENKYYRIFDSGNLVFVKTY